MTAEIGKRYGWHMAALAAVRRWRRGRRGVPPPTRKSGLASGRTVQLRMTDNIGLLAHRHAGEFPPGTLSGRGAALEALADAGRDRWIWSA